MRETERPRVVDRRTRFLAWLTSLFVRALYATLRVKVHHEREVHEMITHHNGAILATWHGRTLIPIARWRGRRYRMLVSLSRDGDFLSEYLRFCGLHVIRGSTGRRGAGATREIINALKNGEVLCFTPDGPRGPYGIAQPGVAYFAQRSGKPLFLGGIAAQHRSFANSWDKFMIPWPFTRAVWVYSEPIFVGPGEDLNEATARIQDIINRLQAEAEIAVGHSPEPILSALSNGKQAGDEALHRESA